MQGELVIIKLLHSLIKFKNTLVKLYFIDSTFIKD